MSGKILAAAALSAGLYLSVAPALAVGWGAQTTISNYYVYATGSAFIKVSNLQNPDGCTNAGYLVLDTSAPNFKAIWAQVIAAHMGGATVSLYYNGCLGNYPRVDAVAVPDHG